MTILKLSISEKKKLDQYQYRTIRKGSVLALKKKIYHTSVLPNHDSVSNRDSSYDPVIIFLCIIHFLSAKQDGAELFNYHRNISEKVTNMHRVLKSHSMHTVKPKNHF